MWRRRLLLSLLLAVSFDLAAVAIPTPGGLVWDDDEEAAHLGRASTPSKRPAAAVPVSRANVAPAAPRPPVRLAAATARPAAGAARPRADLSADRPAPTEDH